MSGVMIYLSWRKAEQQLGAQRTFAFHFVSTVLQTVSGYDLNKKKKKEATFWLYRYIDQCQTMSKPLLVFSQILKHESVSKLLI